MKTLLLCFLLGFITQNTMNDILIESKKVLYSRNESFQSTLTNRTTTTLFYYIGIECYTNGDWREVVNDITNPKSKASLISMVSSNETKEIHFSIDNILTVLPPNLDSFRLKIHYGTEVGKIDKLIFSEQFTILKI